MLQNMRDGAGKWIVWVIIVVLILALGLWGISYYFMDGGAQTPPVAKVDGVKITQGQLSNAYNRLRQTQPKLFTAPDAAQKIKAKLLNNLINQQVLYQAASNDDFFVGQQELNAYLMQIPVFQENGQFSQAKFNLIMNRMMYTPAEFMQSLKQEVMINQVRNGIAATTFALPNEAKNFTSLLQETRNMGYMMIPYQRFLSQTKVTDKNIQQYYQQHQKNYLTQEKVSLQYVEITPAAINAEVKATTSELMSYYQNHQDNYSIPARWQVAHILLSVPANATEKQLATLSAKLEGIRKQAEQGKSFANLAKQYSQDFVTANKGGVMPEFTAGSLGRVFEDTVASLKQNEISQPVQTRYGYELIKLIKKQPQQVKSYQEVAAQVKAAYVSQQAHKLMADKQDALANNTFENPNSLQSTAKQMNLKIQTTDLFTRKGEKSGLLANPNIVATAFSDDVLQQGNNSDVITLKDGSLLVLRVAKHVPAAELPLKQVAADIKQQLSKQQAQTMAKALADKVLPMMTTSRKATDVALQNKLAWVTKPNVSRNNKVINPQILQQAFTMSAPVDKQGLNVKVLALSNGDYAIVGVEKVNVPNTDKMKAATLHPYQQQLATIMAASSYAATNQLAKDTVKVKRYAENMG